MRKLVFWVSECSTASAAFSHFISHGDTWRERDNQNDLNYWWSCAHRIYACPSLVFSLKLKTVTLSRRLEAQGTMSFPLMQSPHDLNLQLDYHQNHTSRCFVFVSNCACMPASVHAKISWVVSSPVLALIHKLTFSSISFLHKFKLHM